MESRFEFLEHQFPKLADYGKKAEEAINHDNNICLLNLGRIAETIIKNLCEINKFSSNGTNDDLTQELLDNEIIDEDICRKLDELITIEDEAINAGCDSEIACARLMTTAQELCEWFMLKYGESAFAFLADLFPPDKYVPMLANLAEIGGEAEENLFTNTRYCLICLGDIGEAIVDFLIRENGIETHEREQLERINILSDSHIIGVEVRDTLHDLRMTRNKAVHTRYDDNYISESEGKRLLDRALNLCIWLFKIVMKPGYIVKARMLSQDAENINVLIGSIPAIVPLSEIDSQDDEDENFYVKGRKYIFKVLDKEGDNITLSPKQANHDYNLSISQLYGKYEIGQDVHVYIKRISNSSGAIVQLKDELEAIIPPNEIGRRLYDYDENNKKQIRYEATARVKYFDWTQYPPMLLSLRDVEREKRKEQKKIKTWEYTKSTKPVSACRANRCRTDRKKSAAQDLNFRTLCKTATFEQILKALDEGANPNAKNNNKTTALMTAAQYNKDKRVIEALIDGGAEVNARNNKGNTALMFAAMGNSPEVVETLLNKGADIEPLNNERKNALVYARANRKINDTELMTLLTPEAEREIEAEQEPQKIPEVAQIEETPTTPPAEHEIIINASEKLLKACQVGDTKSAAEALDAGANIDILSHNNKSTPLIIASQFGNLELVNLLLERNPDVNIKNDSGNTALLIALGFNSSDVIMALINAGADIEAVNDKNKNAIDILTRRANLKGTEAWKTLMRPKLQKEFLKLCRSGNESDVREAIEAGVNVNTKNKTLSTVLMYAAKNNTPEVVEILAKAGAELDAQNIHGDTALIYAALYNSEDVVNVLLEAGANINVMNNEGNKALYYARQNYRLADSDVLTKLDE